MMNLEKEIYVLFNCLLWKGNKKVDEIGKNKTPDSEYLGVIPALGGWNGKIVNLRPPCLKITKTKQNKTKAEDSPCTTEALFWEQREASALEGGVSWSSAFHSPHPLAAHGSGITLPQDRKWAWRDQEGRERTRFWFSLSYSLLAQVSSFIFLISREWRVGGQRPDGSPWEQF